MTDSFEVPRASYRQRLTLLFGLLARGPCRIVFAVLAVVGVVTVAGAVQSVGLRAVIDRASAGDLEAVTIAAVVTGFAIGFAGIAGRINTDLQLVLGLQIGLEVDRATVDLTATMPGVEHLERPAYLDQVAALRSSGQNLTSAVFSVIGMVSLALQIALGVALLAAVDPVLVFVPLFAVPSVLLAPRARRIVERAQTSAAEDERVATQLHDLFLRPAAAMELRVFDAEQTLDDRASTAWDRATDARLRGALQSAALSAVGYLLLGIGYIGALALVTVREQRRGDGWRRHPRCAAHVDAAQQRESGRIVGRSGDERDVHRGSLPLARGGRPRAGGALRGHQRASRTPRHGHHVRPRLVPVPGNRRRRPARRVAHHPRRLDGRDRRRERCREDDPRQAAVRLLPGRRRTDPRRRRRPAHDRPRGVARPADRKLPGPSPTRDDRPSQHWRGTPGTPRRRRPCA